jgi:hypothetical protein
MQQPGILQPAEPDSLSIGHRRFTDTEHGVGAASSHQKTATRLAECNMKAAACSQSGSWAALVIMLSGCAHRSAVAAVGSRSDDSSSSSSSSSSLMAGQEMTSDVRGNVVADIACGMCGILAEDLWSALVFDWASSTKRGERLRERGAARTSREMLEQLCAVPPPSPMVKQFLTLYEVVECVDGHTTEGTLCQPAALHSASVNAPTQRWHVVRKADLTGQQQQHAEEKNDRDSPSASQWKQQVYAQLCKEQLLPAEPDFSEAISARVAARPQAFEGLTAAAPLPLRLQEATAAVEAAEAVCTHAATTTAWLCGCGAPPPPPPRRQSCALRRGDLLLRVTRADDGVSRSGGQDADPTVRHRSQGSEGLPREVGARIGGTGDGPHHTLAAPPNRLLVGSQGKTWATTDA